MSFMKQGEKPDDVQLHIAIDFMKRVNRSEYEFALSLGREILYPFNFDDMELCGVEKGGVDFGLDYAWLKEIDEGLLGLLVVCAIYEIRTNPLIDRDNFTVYFLFEKVKEAAEKRDCNELDEYVGLLIESLLKRI